MLYFLEVSRHGKSGGLSQEVGKWKNKEKTMVKTHTFVVKISIEALNKPIRLRNYDVGKRKHTSCKTSKL